MPTRRRTIGNPVANSPLMRKGGAHQRPRSGERGQQRHELDAALEEWRDAAQEMPLIATRCRLKIENQP